MGGGGARPDAGPTPIDVAVTADTDDGSFCLLNGSMPQERLSDSMQGNFTEVGTDAEECKAVLRFVLPVPRGATIMDAKLTVNHVTGSNFNGEDMLVHVFNTPAFPPLNAGHMHTLAQHTDAGLVPETAVIKWAPKAATITSIDLSALVNPVVNRADWAPGQTVTFLLVPDGTTPVWWFGFEDSNAKLIHPPTLHLSYR